MGYVERPDFAGQIAHVTSHATGWDSMFTDALGRERCLALVELALRRYDWALHAYCLLTNHLHLVIETRRATLARGMQWILGVYAREFNEDHGRRGHLVKARYFSKTIETEAHYLECLPYVAMNPVRAGLCRHPAEYPWSSYGAGRGLALPPTPFVRELVEAALETEPALPSYMSVRDAAHL